MRPARGPVIAAEGPALIERAHGRVEGPALSEREHGRVEGPALSEREHGRVEGPALSERKHGRVEGPALSERKHGRVEGPALSERKHGRVEGFTLIELLVVIAIVGILASIGVVVFRHVRVQGAEVSALASLRAIQQAQFAFAQACGNQRYAPTLAALGTPMPATGQAFLSPDMASDPLIKSGYTFVMAGTVVTDDGLTCIGVSPVATYQVTADPVVPGATGLRYFATNTDRVLYEDQATFTGNMPETGAPGHGREVK